MAEIKTRPTDVPVDEFLLTIEDAKKREDCFTISRIMQDVTGAKAVMWGESIVGFGKYHYKYASGKEADWPLAGYSPRKQNITIYLMPGFEQHTDLLKNLGKCKTSVSCLYIKKLSDVNLELLQELVQKSVDEVRRIYPE